VLILVLTVTPLAQEKNPFGVTCATFETPSEMVAFFVIGLLLHG